MNFDFFRPLPDTFFEESYHQKQLGSSLIKQTQESFEQADVVFIGIEDAQFGKSCDSIRRVLYQYFAAKKFPKLYDLGNLVIDEDFSWRKETFYEIVRECLERNIFICFIGGGQAFLHHIQTAYAHAKKYMNIGLVDAQFQLSDNEEETNRSNYLFRSCAATPSYLFNFVQLAYQSYLVNPEAVHLLKEMNFEDLRLGHIRDNIQQAEPLIRDLDILSISTESIKQAETGGQPKCSPNGLYAEEFAQLCRYGGMSDKLTSIGFYDYDALYDANGACAQLLAQSIWCFLEGFAARQGEFPTQKSNSFVKYTVHSDDMELDLVFLKSEKTNRWWMEMPENLALLQKQFFIPCLYEDYETALEGDIPERWLKGFQKLNAKS